MLGAIRHLSLLGQSAGEAESVECVDRPVSEFPQTTTSPPSLPEQEISLTTSDHKTKSVYSMQSQALRFHKIGTFDGEKSLEEQRLSGKHVVAEVLPQNTQRKAIKSVVGDAVIRKPYVARGRRSYRVRRRRQRQI